MYLLGKEKILLYAFKSPVLLLFAVVITIVMLASIVIAIEQRSKLSMLVLCGLVLVCLVSYMQIQDIRNDYKEYGEEFLNAVGVNLVYKEKYKDTEIFTSEIHNEEVFFEPEAKKIVKMSVGHYSKGGKGKEYGELRIELDNKSTVILLDGEQLLQKGDFEEEDIYLTISDFSRLGQIEFNKEDDHWLVKGGLANFVLLKGEEDLKYWEKDTSNSLNK